MHCAARLLLLLCLSRTAVADNPDPVALARKSIAANKANSPKAQQYAYREYKVDRRLDASGKETERETETWDIIGLEGSTYRKLILRDDKPLPPKEQKREDERLRKETELRKKETPEERHRRLFSFSYSFSFDYDKVADIFDLRYVGEELIDGRQTYVIEGTPKPDFRPTTDNEKETMNYKVKIWILQHDYFLVRMDFDVVGDRSRMQKGSHIREELAPHDDGVWLTSAITFRYTARFFKMMTARGEMVATYSDYRKFQVDSRVVEMETPHTPH